MKKKGCLCFSFKSKPKDEVSYQVANFQSNENSPNLRQGDFVHLENDIAFRKGRVLYTKGITEIFQGFSVEGAIITVKRIKLKNTPEVHTICNVLKKLINATKNWEHINLVTYLGANFDPITGEFFIFTEYVANEYESIKKIIKDEHTIQFFIYQILKALKFLNDKGIKKVGNFKANNLLLETGGIIKLRDYIGNDYFRILKKISEEDRTEIPESVNDLLEIKRLILDFAYNIKMSAEFISFVKLLDQLSNRDDIDFQLIFSHPFMQIKDRELNLIEKKPTNQFKKTDNGLSSLKILDKDRPGSNEMIGSFSGGVPPTAVPKSPQQNILQFWNDEEPSRQKSEPRTIQGSQQSLNPQISVLQARQNDLLARFYQNTEVSPSIDEVQNKSSEPSSKNSESEPKKSDEPYNDLLNIINQQNSYIKYLESEMNDLKSGSRPSNVQYYNTHVNSKVMDRKIINNNIVINNIGKHDPDLGRENERENRARAEKAPFRKPEQIKRQIEERDIRGNKAYAKAVEQNSQRSVAFISENDESDLFERDDYSFEHSSRITPLASNASKTDGRQTFRPSAGKDLVNGQMNFKRKDHTISENQEVNSDEFEYQVESLANNSNYFVSFNDNQVLERSSNYALNSKMNPSDVMTTEAMNRARIEDSFQLQDFTKNQSMRPELSNDSGVDSYPARKLDFKNSDNLNQSFD